MNTTFGPIDTEETEQAQLKKKLHSQLLVKDMLEGQMRETKTWKDSERLRKE